MKGFVYYKLLSYQILHISVFLTHTITNTASPGHKIGEEGALAIQTIG